MTAERWIKIGTVFTGSWPYRLYLSGTGRYAECQMTWRGRRSILQPWEFAEWNYFWAAVRHRLAMARMELALQLPVFEREERGAAGLWVFVRRMKTTTRFKLKLVTKTLHARLYEYTSVRGSKQQWVPNSVCKVLVETGEIHEVTIENWWLQQNPFEPKESEQAGLF